MVWRQVTVDETIDSARDRSRRTGEDADAGRGRLRLVFPAELDVVIEVGRGRIVLGRQSDAASVPPVPDATVSRSHLAVEWDEPTGAHVVRDLGSRNGSTADGVDLRSGWHPLLDGSVVRIGDVLFVYEAGHTCHAVSDVAAKRTAEAIPGRSLAMRRLREKLNRAARDVSPVLIRGATGTGKERIAREVHRASGRPGEWVAVNCAAFQSHLIESELFGHVKGAFTGATDAQRGLFRTAEGGTLLLDEIGEMPLELQPKLLRAIQEREVRPVGSSESARVDVRIVAATHQDLPVLVESGRFRQDLYARLALWDLAVPALSERRGDLLAWVDRLYEDWCLARGVEPGRLLMDVDAAEVVLRASWADNLRAIDRLVHELARLGAARRIERFDLPEWLRSEVP